jgi:hypothetical protein
MYCNTLGFLSFTLQKQVIACNILLINMLNKFIYAVQKKSASHMLKIFI